MAHCALPHSTIIRFPCCLNFHSGSVSSSKYIPTSRTWDKSLCMFVSEVSFSFLVWYYILKLYCKFNLGWPDFVLLVRYETGWWWEGMEHNVEPVPGWARCPGENEIAPRAGNVFRALDSGTVRVDIRVAEGSLFVDFCIIGYSPICQVV